LNVPEPTSVLVLVRGTNSDLLTNRDPETGNSGIEIRLLTLEGQSELQDQGTNPCHGIDFIHVSNSRIAGCVVRDFEMDGIYLGREGTRFGPSNGNTISRCRLINNLRNGISVTRGHGNMIEECNLQGNNRGAVRAPRLYRAAAIDIEPNVAGDDCSGISVRKCLVRRNYFTGIQCLGPGQLGGFMADDCSIENNGGNGITLVGRDGFLFTVRDCLVTANSGIGIFIAGQIHPVITHNVIVRNGRHGILLDQGALDDAIGRNTIDGNAGEAIKYSGTAVRTRKKGS
jgi:parallel beta-helix repeat protein